MKIDLKFHGDMPLLFSTIRHLAIDDWETEEQGTQDP
jgi:hypothetical protein